MGPYYIVWSIYDCKQSYYEDQIWLQSWSQKGFDMIAISIPKRTIYDCNPFQKGSNMTAMPKFVPESRVYDESRENNISMIAMIFAPFWKGLQSYQVPFVTKIAIIFGPHGNFVCNHKWSGPILKLGIFELNFCLAFCHAIFNESPSTVFCSFIQYSSKSRTRRRFGSYSSENSTSSWRTHF